VNLLIILVPEVVPVTASLFFFQDSFVSPGFLMTIVDWYTQIDAGTVSEMLIEIPWSAGEKSGIREPVYFQLISYIYCCFSFSILRLSSYNLMKSGEISISGKPAILIQEG